jgi:hypothetical protein
VLGVVEVLSLLVLIPLRTRWTPPAAVAEGGPGGVGEVPIPRGTVAEEARRSSGASSR